MTLSHDLKVVHGSLAADVARQLDAARAVRGNFADIARQLDSYMSGNQESDRMDEFIRRMREQQEIVTRAMEGPAKYIRENQAAITRMQDLVRRMDVAAASLVTPGFVNTLDRYAREQRQMHETTEHLALSHQAWMREVAEMSTLIKATQSTLPTIDFRRVGDLIGAANLQRDAVARLTDRLLFSHADLIESISQPAGPPASVPAAVSDLPSQDVFIHTSAVRSITPHEPLDDKDEEIAFPLRHAIITDTDDFLERTLPQLKPAFLEQYRGVKARADDRGPDGWTQGSASMRKLLKGVLHSVAPNDVVLPWAKENNKDLDKDKRPTRATKIEWLCRSIPQGTYRAYVRIEIASALALIDLVDNAQHVDEFPEFAEQYNLIVARVAFCVRHMLEVWYSTLTNTLDQ